MVTSSDQLVEIIDTENQRRTCQSMSHLRQSLRSSQYFENTLANSFGRKSKHRLLSSRLVTSIVGLLLLSRTNVTNVRKPSHKRPISPPTNERIREKNRSAAISAAGNSLRARRSPRTCARIRVNGRTNVNAVEKHSRIVQH